MIELSDQGGHEDLPAAWDFTLSTKAANISRVIGILSFLIGSRYMARMLCPALGSKLHAFQI
jgi:hypothetical protein